MVLSFGIFLFLFNGAAAAAAPRPNIVWIMADDLGVGEPGAFPNAHPNHGRLATPHLDRFAAEGLRFSAAYAGYTVCAPSRTAFFTGRHSGNFVKHGLDGELLGPGEATTTAMLLQRAGYATAASGKLAPMTAPLQQGFDRFLLGQLDQAQCHNMYPRMLDAGAGFHNLNLTQNWAADKGRTACMARPADFNYTVDMFQDAALAWLDGAAADASGANGDAATKPFFLYLAFTVPHAGGWGDDAFDAPDAAPHSHDFLAGAPVPTDAQYGNESSWPEVERDHAAVVTYLDGKVGELMAKLKAAGVDDNTVSSRAALALPLRMSLPYLTPLFPPNTQLVFFASDNGAHLEGGHDYKFFNSTGGLLGHKRSQYEGGFRSPIMARWPASVAAGTVSDFAWAFWDVMPTLAELAGVDAAQLPAGIDGVSIVPTLLGQAQPPKEYLYFTWPGTTKGSAALTQRAWEAQSPGVSGYSVRQGEWKGVVQHCADNGALAPSAGDDYELYHLTSDPFEQTDVARGHADIVAQLKALVISKNLTCACYQCAGPSHVRRQGDYRCDAEAGCLLDEFGTMTETRCAANCTPASPPRPPPSSYCSLNGEVRDGACKCDSGWVGETCGTLDLLPVSAEQQGNGSTKGLVYPPPAALMSSWGGGIVSQGGLFHLYVSEMGGHCGLESWCGNSLIRHAVSDNLVGPYEPREVVQQAMSHNAYPVLHNGTFYVHHIGNGHTHTFTAGCTNGTTPESAGCGMPPPPPGPGSPPPTPAAVLTGASASGPWVDQNITCDPAPCPTWSNPAAFIFPNGSTVLLLSMRTTQRLNATVGGFQVAKAPTPLGPFKPVLGDWGVSPINTEGCEDSFVWVNERGYHAIFHCYGRPGGDSGGYAWSLDGRSWNTTTNPLKWQPPAHPDLPFTDTIAQSDGSTQKYYQRQRPKLFFGDNGAPAALITGLDAKSKNHPNPWQQCCEGKAGGTQMKAIGCDVTITHMQLIRQRP